MPKKCCIPNCKIQEDDPEGLQLNFFKIPKDESRKKQWLTIINNHFKTEIKLPKFPTICSLHFEQTSFNLGMMAVRMRLKNEACPSIFSVNGIAGRSDLNATSNNIQNDLARVIESIKTEIPDETLIKSEENIYSDDKNTIFLSTKNFYEIPNETLIKKESICSDDENTNFCSTKNFCEIPNETVIKEENISSDDENTIRIQNPLNLYQSNIIGHNNSSNIILDNSHQLKCNPNNSNEHLEYNCVEPTSSKIFQKSFANISIDTINFKDETVVRALFIKAQNEVKDLRQKYRIQAMKFYRAERKIKSFGNPVRHTKKQRILSPETQQMAENT